MFHGPWQRHKDLVSIHDLSAAEVEALFQLAANVKARPERYRTALSGQTLAMIFEKSSTRTRVSFEVGMYQLGGLATAWPRLQQQPSLPALTEALRQSAWGIPGPVDAVALRDVLTLAWLRRLSAAAPAASGWARSASTLVAARMLLVDHTTPTSRVLDLVRPWLGRDWANTRDLDRFRASLPRFAQTVLDGVDDPADLWRAEARMRAEVEADGFRLIHAPLPGPDVVVGAIAVLAVDGWRLRAALAAADAGTGSSEVLDAVA